MTDDAMVDVRLRADGVMPDARSYASGVVLDARDLVCGYDGEPVIEGLSFQLRAGEVCALLGPNGVGKTTVFKSILGHLPLLGGSVAVKGRDVAGLSRAQLARLAGYVPQAHTPPFPYTVAEMVEMGRTAHVPLAAVPGRQDRMIALEAMNALGIAHLHDRPYTQISGGERQLALIARALCQQADVLIMDEPCANLDFGNAARVLHHIGELAQEGKTVLMTTHSPDHALCNAHKVIAIAGRSEFSFGAPADVIDADLLERMYDVSAHVGCVRTPEGDVPVAVPLRQRS